MRGGYHIRIVLHPNPPLPTSDPSPNTHIFIPTSIFQHLPSHPPKHTARRNALFNPKHKDYRYGPIRFDWVDFDKMSATTVSGKAKEHGRGMCMLSPCIEYLCHNRPETATATFIPHAQTKSGSANLPEGTGHVYRETSSNQQPPIDAPISVALEDDPETAGGVMLAVLAVPAWMTPSDFLTFVAPAAEGVVHLRMIRYLSICKIFEFELMDIFIRDSLPNRSIVVVNFSKAADAAEFAEAYNGKPFNSMEVSTWLRQYTPKNTIIRL